MADFNVLTAKIAGSVGRGGINNHNDVVVIQELLNRCRVGGPTTKLILNGKVDHFTQATISAFQERFFSSSFWAAGWRDGRVDIHGPTFWLMRLDAANTETPTESISFQIPGILQPIQQIGPTCWAAASVMLMSWKKQNRSLNVRDEIEKIGPEWLEYYDAGTGLPWDRHQQFADAAGFNFKPPASYSLKDFRRLLTRPSPLYVSFTMSAQAAHAIVVIGMEGDGTSIGTDLVVHDTAIGFPPDRMPFVLLQLWMSFTQSSFNRDKSPIEEHPNSQLFFL